MKRDINKEISFTGEFRWDVLPVSIYSVWMSLIGSVATHMCTQTEDHCVSQLCQTDLGSLFQGLFVHPTRIIVSHSTRQVDRLRKVDTEIRLPSYQHHCASQHKTSCVV